MKNTQSTILGFPFEYTSSTEDPNAGCLKFGDTSLFVQRKQIGLSVSDHDFYEYYSSIRGVKYFVKKDHDSNDYFIVLDFPLKFWALLGDQTFVLQIVLRKDNFSLKLIVNDKFFKESTDFFTIRIEGIPEARPTKKKNNIAGFDDGLGGEKVDIDNDGEQIHSLLIFKTR